MQFKPYYYYWGKAMPSEDAPPYHLFPYHCLDVAAVASVWLDASPTLRKVFFRASSPETWRVLKGWLLFFVANHDLGKLDARFQNKAEEAAKQLCALFAKARKTPGFDHGRAGMSWFCQEWLQTPLAEHDEECLEAWMGAVAGHHGQLLGAAGIHPPSVERAVNDFDRHARLSWMEDLSKLFLEPVEALDYILPPISQTLLAGFCSVCDWLGSGTDYFKYESEPGIELEVYFQAALDKAEVALKESGLLASPLSEGGMAMLYPGFEPRAAQLMSQDLPLEPGMTVIQDMTGSGKTEAALAYASRLLAAGLADSIIFALPTQATANAMLARLKEIASRMFPTAGANLLLAHGKARYNPAFKGLKRMGRAKTAQGSEEAGVYCSQWLGSSRKRVFLGQIGVCTIDQVLLSVLPIRHRFVRSFGVQKSILIVDEVHAYDSYMNVLLEEVLKCQRASGGSAILLSATLPSRRMRRLVDAWNKEAQLGAGYPLISHIPLSGQAKHYPLPKPPNREVEIEQQICENMLPDEALLKRVLAAAADGGRVAIICNLVADAQQIHRALQAMTSSITIDLFHSRFCFGDRQQIESEVIALYGKDASASGRVLVATQVIEQSLDLDFDWMITQLCPIDLLFQRLGRLFRHQERIRPAALQTAACVVLIPPPHSEQGTRYGFHSAIYEDTRVLWRSESWLKQAATIAFPDAYTVGIEAVYDSEPWPDEPAEITQRHEEYLLKLEEPRRYGAHQLISTDANPWRDTDANASRLTRDGEMSLNVVLVQAGTPSRFLNGRTMDAYEDWELDEALNFNTVPVPHSWLRELPEADQNLNDMILLELSPAESGWQGQYRQTEYLYHPQTGLEKRKRESVD